MKTWHTPKQNSTSESAARDSLGCWLSFTGTRKAFTPFLTRVRNSSSTGPTPSSTTSKLQSPGLGEQRRSVLRCRCQYPRHRDGSLCRLISSACIFRVHSRRCFRFICCQAIGAGRPDARSCCSCLLGFIAILLNVEFNPTRHGWRNSHNLSSGVGLLSFVRTEPPPSTQSTIPGPCYFIGQVCSQGLSGLADEPRCGSDFSFSEGRARSCLTEFLTLETSPNGWHHAILRQLCWARSRITCPISRSPATFEITSSNQASATVSFLNSL